MMKKRRAALFSFLIFMAAALGAISFLSYLRTDDYATPSESPGMYRPGTIVGLPHEHAPGATGMIAGTTAVINSLGFRGPELNESPSPNSRRIVVIGDSVVFGQGVAEDDTLSAQLKRQLERSFPDQAWETANAGVRGYNSGHYLIVLTERVLPLAPDLIVLVITEINDPEVEPFVPHSEKMEAWKNSRWVNLPFVKPFYAGAFVEESSRLVVRHVRDIYDPEGSAWPIFIRNLSAIRDHCRERNIALVAVSFPTLVDEEPFEPQRRQLQAALDDLTIAWIDPAPALSKWPAADLVVSRHDFHPNGRALGVVAEQLVGPIIDGLEKRAR